MSDFLWISINICISLFLVYIVNVIADNLPYKKFDLGLTCYECGNKLSFFNYFNPSYRCSNYCNAIYPMRRFIVLVIFVILSLWISIKTNIQDMFWFYWIDILFFSIAIIIDFEHHLIPYPLSVIGSIIGIFSGIYTNGWLNTILGISIGFILMFIFYWLGFIISKWLKKNKNSPALGLADVIIASIAGLFLGFPNIILSFFLSIIVASIISLAWLIYLAAKKNYKPFTKVIPIGGILSAITLVILLLKIY